jgi:transposase
VELLLIKHFIEKSNREMANMLVIFSILSGINTSYKSVERLYSDEKVFMALLNLHSLILKKKGIEKVVFV